MYSTAERLRVKKKNHPAFQDTKLHFAQIKQFIILPVLFSVQEPCSQEHTSDISPMAKINLFIT